MAIWCIFFDLFWTFRVDFKKAFLFEGFYQIDAGSMAKRGVIRLRLKKPCCMDKDEIAF